MPQRYFLPRLPLLSRKMIIHSLNGVFKHDAECFGQEETHGAGFAGMNRHAPVGSDVNEAGDEEADMEAAVAVQEGMFGEMEEACQEV